MKSTKSLKTSIVIVILSIVFSRFTGFIRELVIPNVFGINETSDAFNIAFRITGLIYDLLIGGAISAALIPTLSRCIAKNEEDSAWDAISSYINIAFITLLFVTLAGLFFAPQIVQLIAKGFKSSEQLTTTIDLFRILLCSVIFLMLSGVITGILNAYNMFTLSALIPSFYNLMCAFSIFMTGYLHLNIIYSAFGMVLSSVLFFILQIFIGRKQLKHYLFIINFKNTIFLSLIMLSIPSIMASSIVQLNILILASYATLFGSGSVTAFTIADRTWQLPYGVIAQGLGIVLLPTLSSKLANNMKQDYARIFEKGLKLIIVATFPLAILFIFCSRPILITLFKISAKFNANAIITTSNILSIFAIALVFQSIVTYLNRAFYANNDTKTPFYTGFMSTIVLIISVNLLFKYSNYGIYLLPIAYALSSITNCSLLLIFQYKGQKILKFNNILINIVKVIPASIIFGIFMSFMLSILDLANMNKLYQMIYLSFNLILSTTVYLFILYLLKLPEILQIKTFFKNKLIKI